MLPLSPRNSYKKGKSKMSNKVEVDKDLGETEALKEVVTPDSEMKEWMINHVGNKHSPEDSNVTVEMIVNTMAEEFPEFLMAVAEENWIRGYHQALTDVQLGEEIAREQQGDQDPNEEKIG